MTATFVVVEVIRSTPWNGVVNVGNNSSTKVAMCPDGGTALDARSPVDVPSNSVSSNIAVVDVAEVFVIATPERSEPIAPGVPETSAYIRKAALVPSAGTPASATVTPPMASENTPTPEGDELPASRATRTDPTDVAPAGLDVCSRTELRGAIAYAKAEPI